MVKTSKSARHGNDVRIRILETASALFYQRGVHAVGVDVVVERAGVAKTSLYRHFGSKDDLVAAFLAREDRDFWSTWDRVAERHEDDPRAELDAHLAWIGERIGRPGYRGCPQINVAAEFAEAEHPARKVAAAHKQEMRKRLKGVAERLDAARPDELARQLALLINGAFVSSQLLEASEAVPVLRGAAHALIAANRSRPASVDTSRSEVEDSTEPASDTLAPPRRQDFQRVTSVPARQIPRMPSYDHPSFARTYADATRRADTSHLRSRFLVHVPHPADAPPHLLDLGCGSGRDALAFRQAGYRIDALDASAAMAGLAREHAGIPVRVLRAQDLEDSEAYDGIWACASLLHVPWDALPDVFRRLERALRRRGVLYASFKPGEGERTVDDGRHFTDMTEARLRDRIRDAPGLEVIEVWQTSDVRPERTHEPWLNVLLRRERR
jgi:AcrR family transcriptional regulator/SAM-dependent methyltransferase